MKTFLLDLLDWMATPDSFWLHLEAFRQERERRPQKPCPQCKGHGYVDA